MNRGRFLLLLVAVSLLALGLRAWGLASQPLSADDRMVGVSAVNYVETGHLGPTMWNHPGLRNLLVYGTLSLLGPGVLPLKTSSLLLGALTVPLVILLTLRLTGSRAAALIAGFLLALDSLHIDFSRQAVQEVYMAFFAAAGVWSVLRWKDSKRLGWLLLAGLTFGLGVAAKWIVLFPMGVMIVFLVYEALGQRGGVGAKAVEALSAAAILGLLPLTVYVLTFLPWFQRGYDLSEWVRLQQSMAAETAQHTGEHNPYLYENDYRAFLWFIKPVAYVDFTMEGERAVIFAGISNPLVWLLTLPAMIWVALRAAREKVPDGWLLVALFLATYLPFALTTRPQWAHSALSVLPFCVAAIAWALRMRWLPGRELWIYLAAVVIVSLPLYLLAIGAGYEIPLLRSIIEIYRPSYGH